MPALMPPPPNLHGGYVSGRAYAAHEGQFANITVQAVDQLYLYPFRIYRPVTINALCLRVNTAGAASQGKCGIWGHNYATARPTGKPVAAQNTPIDTATGGFKQVALAASVMLTPGLWWFGSEYTQSGGALPNMACLATGSSLTAALVGAGTVGNVVSVAGLNGFSTPSAFASDIAALDLTSAAFADVSGAAGAVPAGGFVVA